MIQPHLNLSGLCEVWRSCEGVSLDISLVILVCFSGVIYFLLKGEIQKSIVLSINTCFSTTIEW